MSAKEPVFSQKEKYFWTGLLALTVGWWAKPESTAAFILLGVIGSVLFGLAAQKLFLEKVDAAKDSQPQDDTYSSGNKVGSDED